MEFFLFGLVVLAIVAVIATIAVISAMFEKRRTEGLKLVAEQLGLAFYPQGDSIQTRALSSLQFFSQGRHHKTANMIHGVAEGTEVTILDFQYVTGHGKQKQTWKQTVVCFSSTELELPGFALRPETLFDKLGGAFGSQDIDFADYPRFSKLFLLRGYPEEQVRELFTPAIIAYFEARPGVSVEGNGQRLIFYRARRRPKPEEVHGLLREGFEAFGLFKRGS
jgi:hypothetical protein